MHVEGAFTGAVVEKIRINLGLRRFWISPEALKLLMQYYSSPINMKIRG
ncbi:MAG: hypothetical protein AB7U29_17300 [Desulfobulbus sp.]